MLHVGRGRVVAALKMKQPIYANMKSFASDGLRTTPQVEIRTVFGVGKVVDKRSDGVTELHIQGHIRAFFQPGDKASRFTTDVDRLQRAISTEDLSAVATHIDQVIYFVR